MGKKGGSGYAIKSRQVCTDDNDRGGHAVRPDREIETRTAAQRQQVGGSARTKDGVQNAGCDKEAALPCGRRCDGLGTLPGELVVALLHVQDVLSDFVAAAADRLDA